MLYAAVLSTAKGYNFIVVLHNFILAYRKLLCRNLDFYRTKFENHYMLW